jgi:hypothetical protein
MELRGDGPRGPDRLDQGGRSAGRPPAARKTGRPEAQILSLIGRTPIQGRYEPAGM